MPGSEYGQLFDLAGAVRLVMPMEFDETPGGEEACVLARCVVRA